MVFFLIPFYCSCAWVSSKTWKSNQRSFSWQTLDSFNLQRTNPASFVLFSGRDWNAFHPRLLVRFHTFYIHNLFSTNKYFQNSPTDDVLQFHTGCWIWKSNKKAHFTEMIFVSSASPGRSSICFSYISKGISLKERACA